METVIVRDFDGNTLFKFWQYGLIDWELLYECLRKIVLSERDWEVFKYDEYEPTRRGAHCPPSREIPLSGTYILLQPDGSPIHIRIYRPFNNVYVTAILVASCWVGRLKNVYLLVFGRPTFSLLDMNPSGLRKAIRIL
ncbi:hypothetical protein AX14_009223 [Amanita brunnescens Koide BX004]|nr:hypothetical protein AX14_009223 [Amanita brunnescens Koide BX004]